MVDLSATLIVGKLNLSSLTTFASSIGELRPFLRELCLHCGDSLTLHRYNRIVFFMYRTRRESPSRPVENSHLPFQGLKKAKIFRFGLFILA